MENARDLIATYSDHNVSRVCLAHSIAEGLLFLSSSDKCVMYARDDGEQTANKMENIVTKIKRGETEGKKKCDFIL